MLIEDGRGASYKAQVDSNNRLRVSSISLTEQRQANSLGNAFNINTGNISFTAAGTLLYIANNEDLDLVIESFVFGMGSATQSDSGELTIVRNPTGGDLITDATAVDMFQDRNFGSANTLTANAYKGKSGGTLTGGDDIALIYQVAQSRVSVPINIILPKGQSVGISVDPKLSSGSVKMYAASTLYLKAEA